MILSLKTKKVLAWMATAVTVAVMASVFGGFGSFEKQHARVDRTNAMQVAKPVMPEPIMQVSAPDFFTEYRLEREKIRSERADLLRESIKQARTDDMRQKIQETVLKLALEKQRESEIENLIKARGFSDALVFIRDNSINAVVKATSLSKEEVLQVADVISRQAGIKQEDITISAKP